MDIFFVVVLCSLGIILILLEIFLLPGITFAAVGGALFGVGGVVYAYSNIGLVAGNISLVSSIVVFVIVFYWLVKSKALDALALKTMADATVSTDVEQVICVGDEGLSISRLNPMGKAMIKQTIVEVKSEDGFIDEDIPIVVVKIHGKQIVVIPI
ncbi:hypothetical protein AwDysgo_03240 [Bacteroidales bacterium]|nr:hypothetical protein AwDysgo_03240 [Bacteroidales bacterium]